VSEWRRFEKEWVPILKSYGVKMMHRADLETWHGEFTAARGWNPERRKALLNELHPIIKNRAKVAIGVTPVKWTAEGLRLTPLSSGSFRS
jgi:hypothetical protein